MRDPVAGGFHFSAAVSVGPVQWLERSQMGDEISALLPPTSDAAPASMAVDLQRVFKQQAAFTADGRLSLVWPCAGDSVSG
jgi:hypothetical protein